MAGNPIAKDPEYKSYVLSHTFALKFLDYRLIDAASVQSALESYQAGISPQSLTLTSPGPAGLGTPCPAGHA